MLPCSKHFAAVGARITEVFNALVDYLDVTVEVAFLAEYLIALRTCGWLVDLDVQMHLGDIFRNYFKSCHLKGINITRKVFHLTQ